MGSEALSRSIADPLGSMQYGIRASKSGVKMAVEAMCDPVGSAKWGLGVTANAAELVQQYYKDVAAKVFSRSNF